MKKILVSLGLLMGFALPSMAQKVSVDFSCQKFIGGESTLKKEKYFNIHQNPFGNDFNNSEFNYLVKDLNVGYGRFFGGPRPAKTIDDGKNISDAALKAEGQRSIKSSRNNSRLGVWNSSDLIVTNHPTPKKNSSSYGFKWRGENANYSKEALYAARWFKHSFGTFDGVTKKRPTYYEPINEPYVHAGDFGVDQAKVRKEMARFHAQLAKEIHKQAPGVKVAGYASAWPSMELWGFRHWKERMKLFMDVAGDDMDCFATHLYDGKNVTGGDSFRSGSNSKAILDMIEAYSFIKWGKVKPHLISEYGMTRPDWIGAAYSDDRNRRIVRSINNFNMTFINMPDKIVKAVPFITGKATWFYNSSKNPNKNPYPWVISRKVNGKWQWTDLQLFYQFWKVVKGNRVRVFASDPDIQTAAFVEGNKGYLVLNNMEFTTKTVQLDMLKNLGVRSIKKYSLEIVSGDFKLTTASLSPNVSSLKMKAEQPVILEFTFDKSISFDNKEEVKKYYATTYLQPISANKVIDFDVNGVAAPKSGTASLRMNLGRALKKSLRPEVKVNGTKVSVPTDWEGYDQKDRGNNGFFGVIEIPVDVSLLKSNNKVTFKFSDGGGHIASVSMTVNTLEKGNVAPPPVVNEDIVLLSDKKFTEGTKDFSFEFSYSANVEREIYAEIRSPQGKFLSSNVVIVPPSSREATVKVNIGSAPATAKGYELRAHLRPVGTDWKEQIKKANTRFDISSSTDKAHIGTAGAEDTFVAIYPNPVDSFLSLEGMAEGITWKIYTLQGVEVMSGQENSIDLTHLREGVYHIGFSTGQVERLMKTK